MAFDTADLVDFPIEGSSTIVLVEKCILASSEAAAARRLIPLYARLYPGRTIRVWGTLPYTMMNGTETRFCFSIQPRTSDPCRACGRVPPWVPEKTGEFADGMKYVDPGHYGDCCTASVEETVTVSKLLEVELGLEENALGWRELLAQKGK